MIKRIEKNILIEKFPDEVFSYISNLENLPNYTSIYSSEKVSGDGGIGSIYSISIKTLLSRRSSKIVVTKNIKPDIFAYKDTSQIYDNEVGFQLEGQSSGTYITAYIQADISTLGSLFGGINKNSEIELEKAVQKIKEVVESIETVEKNETPTLANDISSQESRIEITSENTDIELSLGKTPEEIAVKFKKSNY